MSTLALSLLFSLLVASMTAAATAVRSVSRIWLRHWAERELSGASNVAIPDVGRPHRYLLAAGTGIASVAFALGALVAFREDRSTLLGHLGAAALLLLLVGQLIPRAIARHWVTALVPTLMPLLQVLDALFGPILGFAAKAVRPFVPRAASPPPRPTDPLGDLLREAEAEGLGVAGESEIISGVVEFGEKRIRGVLTPLSRVTSVTTTMPGAEIAQSVARSNYTRIPVFGREGEVVGVLHSFDVLVHPDEPLATLRPAASATVDEPCGVVMRRMLRDHGHLAIVRDGAAVAGIVTLEDLVEELVGDIRDEHDEPGGG